jgi:ATP-dependent RNA helicase DHX29
MMWQVKALTPAEDLTPLGQQLAKLPLDVYLGKLILFGSIFQCLDLTLTLAAILSSKSPFSAPMAARQQANLARMAFKRGDSDLLTLWKAYFSWRKTCRTQGASEFQFCRKNYLSPQALSNIEDLKQQLLVSVVDAGFLELGEGERAALSRYDPPSR